MFIFLVKLVGIKWMSSILIFKVIKTIVFPRYHAPEEDNKFLTNKVKHLISLLHKPDG